MLEMFFLVLYMDVQARGGGYMPQYISMPSDAACKAVLPKIVTHAENGTKAIDVVPSGVMTQKPGEPIKERLDDFSVSGNRVFYAECVTMEIAP